MLNMLNKVAKQFTDKKETIKSKIQELESQKMVLQKQLEVEFDNQVEAEMSGANYDESTTKKINSQLIEIQGRIEAYSRQLSNQAVKEQDKEQILAEAAEQFKKIHSENLKNSIKRYELDEQIRQLMDNGKHIEHIRDDMIYTELKCSALFPEMDETTLRNLVINKADLPNDEEIVKLQSALKEIQSKKSAYTPFIWN